VWYPVNKNDRDHREKAQRRATKVVPWIRDLPYEERLRNLKLQNLAYRRRRGDMIQIHKIFHGFEDIPENSLVKLAGEGIKRGHSLKLKKPRHRTVFRNHFFSLRVIKDGNGLHEGVVNAPSLLT